MALLNFQMKFTYEITFVSVVHDNSQDSLLICYRVAQLGVLLLV